MTRVIIHDTDLDGYTSALNLRKEGTVNIPWNDRTKLPDIPDECTELDIVDLSFPEEMMDNLFDSHNKLRVIDHHKSSSYLTNKIYGHWNDQHSAAMLCWKINRKSEYETLSRYVEDRDLWRFQLPDSREINEYLATKFYNLPTLDVLEELSNTLNLYYNTCISIGSNYITKRNSLINSIIDEWKKKPAYFNGIPVICLPTALISDGLEVLKEVLNTPLVAGYRNISDPVTVSFRGEGSYNIATSLGGGGHALAAGARVNLQEFISCCK